MIKKILTLLVCVMISLGVLAHDKMPDQSGVSAMQTVMTTAAPAPEPAVEDVIVGTIPEATVITLADEDELTPEEQHWVKSQLARIRNFLNAVLERDQESSSTTNGNVSEAMPDQPVESF